MEETNLTKVNACEQHIHAETPVAHQVHQIPYTVNSTAESVLNIVAMLILIVGVIAAFFVLGICIFKADSYSLVGLAWEWILFGFLGALFTFFICGLLPWACIKVYINISRNLFAIRRDLYQLKSGR